MHLHVLKTAMKFLSNVSSDIVENLPSLTEKMDEQLK